MAQISQDPHRDALDTTSALGRPREARDRSEDHLVPTSNSKRTKRSRATSCRECIRLKLKVRSKLFHRVYGGSTARKTLLNDPSLAVLARMAVYQLHQARMRKNLS